MRILILNFILSTAIEGKIIRRESNADTMIYNMARGFVADGHSVTLAAAEDFRPSEPENNPFEVVYFKSRFKRLFKPHLLPNPKGLTKWLRKNSADFDMILSVETFSIPTLIASLVSRDKLIIWQEMAFHQHLLGGIPSKIWYNLVARLVIRKTLVVPQSENARNFISHYLKNVSATIVGHGTDQKRFFPSNEIDMSFVVISMLVARKQIDGILYRFADFLHNTPHKQFRLDIIGEGPEKERLEKIVADLGIKENVIFHGFLQHSEIASISRRSKALLINTRQDNNMVTIPESIVNGTPVLTTSVPNNSAFILEHELGIVKDNWTWEDLNTMIDRYEEYHTNCITHRDRFTNSGVARSIIKEFSAKQ